jgi:hypothetical protein
MTDQKRHEKLIIDNRSSKPLYESYEAAFDCYFWHWSEEQPNYACETEEFTFNVRTNKDSITIVIFDKNK